MDDKKLVAAIEKINIRRESRLERQERNRKLKESLAESSCDQEYLASGIAFYAALPVRSKRCADRTSTSTARRTRLNTVNNELYNNKEEELSDVNSDVHMIGQEEEVIPIASYNSNFSSQV